MLPIKWGLLTLEMLQRGQYISKSEVRCQTWFFSHLSPLSTQTQPERPALLVASLVTVSEHA